MRRHAYLIALLLLQIALVVDCAPALSVALRAQSAILDATSALTAALRFGLVVTAMAGAAFALAGPLFALLRHHQRGAARFRGLPRWAVAIAIAGAALLAVAYLGGIALDHSDLGDLGLLEDLLPTAIDAAIAVTAGGVVAAEVLRRSIPPPRLLGESMPMRQVLVEVVQPDDLRTLPV
jgi:hypothetical protein